MTRPLDGVGWGEASFYIEKGLMHTLSVISMGMMAVAIIWDLAVGRQVVLPSTSLCPYSLLYQICRRLIFRVSLTPLGSNFYYDNAFTYGVY